MISPPLPGRNVRRSRTYVTPLLRGKAENDTGLSWKFQRADELTLQAMRLSPVREFVFEAKSALRAAPSELAAHCILNIPITPAKQAKKARHIHHPAYRQSARNGWAA